MYPRLLAAYFVSIRQAVRSRATETLKLLLQASAGHLLPQLRFFICKLPLSRR